MKSDSGDDPNAPILLNPSANPEAFAAHLLQHLPPSMYVLDLQQISSAYTGGDVLRAMGYSMDAPHKFTQAQMIHAADRGYAVAHLQDASSWQRSTVQFAQRMRNSTGVWHWMVLRESVLQRDVHGDPTHVVGVAHDIDTLHACGAAQAEGSAVAAGTSQALDEARSILGVVLGRAPLILWATDSQGMCTLFQGAGRAPTLAPGSLVGTSLLTFLQHDPVAHAALSAAMRGKACIAKDHFCGPGTYYETHYWPVLGASGMPCGAIGLAFNIAAEEQSRASTAHVARLEEMLDVQRAIIGAPLDAQALIGAIVQRMLRSTPYPSGGVALLDDGTLRVVGATGPGALAVGTELGLHTTLAGACVRSGTALISPSLQNDPRVPQRPEGAQNARSVAVVPVLGGAQVLGVIFAHSDTQGIDDPVHMKSLQLMANLLGSALMQAHELAARQDSIVALRATETALTQARNDALMAMRAKATFLANMSHEIRTPLNGIIGVGDLLVDTPLTEQQALYLQVLQTSGLDLSRLINDILDFSKLESGGLEVEHIRFDIIRLTEAKILLLEPQAESLNLALSCHVDPSLHALVRGDPVRIGQVLLCLLSNAIKFTSRGGVTLEVKCEGEGRVRFMVTDTGVGIAPAEQKHLFEAFSQADRSSTRKYGGSGLGLAISKRLVELMGGSIGVQSTLNQGSTFWFSLPLPALIENKCDDAMSSEAFAEADKTPIRAGAQILVVDDNAVNQLVTAAVLRGLGYKPYVVASGREAVDAVLQASFDAVLMDCHMPGMDGYEAAGLIRATEMTAGTHLPIVALTASDLPADQDRCLQAGMDDWLTKPIDKKSLQKALQRCWRRAGFTRLPA